MAGLADPWRFSLRRLELAARAKRLGEWNRLASLLFELRRTLCKEPGVEYPFELNPIYTDEERAELKKEAKERERARLPEATGAEVFAMITGK